MTLHKAHTMLLGIVLITLTTLTLSSKTHDSTTTTMETQKKIAQVNVWDTYVTKKDGEVMHFDILAPADIKDTNIIYAYGRQYLKNKGQAGQELSTQECKLCHVETLQPKWEQDIADKGYYIIEMDGCN